MADTTSMAIVSARDILELAMPSADSMEVDFTAVAGTAVAAIDRRENRSNAEHAQALATHDLAWRLGVRI